MKKLELYIPAKPYIVTQAFGIYNPAYAQFGFDKHNGIDFRVDTDGIVKAMCDGYIRESGFDTSKGNYIRYRTNEMFEIEGHEAYAEFIYMHADKLLVSAGDIIKAGDNLIIAGNTGFSTGAHTHISAYLVDKDNNRIQLDPRSNHCFDHSKYFNGKYADDIGKATFNRDFGIGALGADVYKFQQILVKNGYAKFNPTGYFGVQTLEAAKAFQDENGVTPITGYVGQKTRKVLEKYT